MDVKLQPFDGGKASKISIADTVFDRDYNESLVQQLITAYLAGGRSGTHAQKKRSEVRGGGKKPFSQKGGGRARAGTIRSPLWRSGGTVFAKKPRTYTKKINRKVYRGAVCAILSELCRNDSLVIVDKIESETAKTKNLLTKITALGLKNVLLVAESVTENLVLASRNLCDVDVTDVAQLNPVALLKFDVVVISQASVRRLEGSLI